MGVEFTSVARRLGLVASSATVILIVAYAITLMVGLATLDSPDEPIGDPMFTILEVLIIIMMPAMVALMVAVHAWAPARLKPFSLTAFAFMVMLSVVTSCLHFVILVLSRQAVFAAQPWLPLFMDFQWPSVAYAIDILGWDIFFAVSMLFGAAVFRGGGLSAWIRRSMILSGLLALAGLSGVVFSDMKLRNIGILGYVGVFLIVAVLLFELFRRSQPRAA